MADATPTPEYGYLSLDEADLLFAQRVDGALWTAYDDSQKAAALQQAFEHIERLRYNGIPTGGQAQTTRFPRVGLIDQEGYAIDDATVPVAVQLAQCLEALALLQTATAISSQRAALQAQGVTRFTLGDLTEEYDLTAAAPAGRVILSPEAFGLLKPYLLTMGGGGLGWPITRW
jgi:hypothetical protein